MKNNLTKKILMNALIAGMYVVLTFILFPISFGPIQMRFSEILVLLCFFNPNYIIGVSLGCLLSNVYSAFVLSPFDLLFGTFSTLLGAFVISKCKSLFVGAFINSLINGIVIGLELTFLISTKNSAFMNMGFVFAGEFIATCVVGYALLMILRRKSYFLDIIDASQNREFRW